MTRKQYAEKYTTRQTLEGESDKWVEVCAAVKGKLFKQSTVGIGREKEIEGETQPSCDQAAKETSTKRVF